MKGEKIAFILIIWIFSSLISQAQSDSTTLTYKEYLENIILFHPIAKKANLQTKIGEAEWLSAKGNLDPKLSSCWSGRT